MHGRSADIRLAEIHLEMSELFDKQVNAQKEKNFQGSHKFPQAHKKCAMKVKESRRKKRQALKIFLMNGRSL